MRLDRHRPCGGVSLCEHCARCNLTSTRSMMLSPAFARLFFLFIAVHPQPALPPGWLTVVVPLRTLRVNVKERDFSDRPN